MKFKFLIISLVSLFTLNGFTAEFKVQKVKTLGPMKHKVIFQSMDLKPIKKTNQLKGKLVAQWGLHVFEVVTGIYTCTKKLNCNLSDYERIATYEKCTVREDMKVQCRRKIGAGSSSENNSREIIVAEDPDSVKDEWHRDYRNDEYSEFPVRIGGEFDDLF